ncbi:MAG: hypothetical protein NT001_01925 [Candidatus Woesearchaeota archaeon]|nr:hypothetical protein [Candidatus Woesearchaeota archaeon]
MQNPKTNFLKHITLINVMDREFIESLKGIPEEGIVAKLKEQGYERGRILFQMANSANRGVSPGILPQGIETHTEILILDYHVLRPNQYEPHQCYAFFYRPSI